MTDNPTTRDSVGVAVIGAGHWGPHLVRNFNDHPSSRTAWVVDRDDARREAIGLRFPDVRMSAAAEDAIADPLVDAVVVATPTSTHYEIVRAALDAGKHVLVEKPMTNSLADALKLCALADSQSRILMVGHVFLFNAAVRAAKDHIDAGDLGVVQYLSMDRTNLGPVRFDVNAAWDLASHDISIANYWLGETPMTARAGGGSWVNEGVHDAVFISLHYPGNVLVNIEASWLNPRKRRLISVVGSERMLTVDDMDLNEPLRIYDKGVVESSSAVTDTFAGFRSQIREGQVVIPHVTSGEPLRSECEAFIARVLGGTDRVSSGWDGANVVAVLEAVDRSLANQGLEQEVEAVS